MSYDTDALTFHQKTTVSVLRTHMECIIEDDFFRDIHHNAQRVLQLLNENPFAREEIVKTLGDMKYLGSYENGTYSDPMGSLINIYMDERAFGAQESNDETIGVLNTCLQKIIEGEFGKIATLNATHAKEALAANELTIVCYNTYHAKAALLWPNPNEVDETTRTLYTECTDALSAFEKAFEVEYPDTA